MTRRTSTWPGRIALTVVLCTSVLFVSCLEEKSKEPSPTDPVADWWTVDDCDATALYNFTGSVWTNTQPSLRFSTNFPEAWRGDALGAVATWNGVGSRLQIMVDQTPTEATVARDGVSVLSCGAIPSQPTALGVTYCWIQGTVQTEVDVVISSERPITGGGLQGCYDLRSVLTHELGHFCGLGDVPTQKQTMSAEQHVESRIYWTLCPGDRLGLLQLYP